MKREEAEKIWRQKFEAFGLDECFEFLYRNWDVSKGKKCGLRCKRCGTEFESWAFAECVRGRQLYISCPNCGISSDGTVRLSKRDNIAQYYMDGHSVKETAEQFGIATYQVNNYVKAKKITNGRLFRQSRVDDQKKEAEKNLAQRLLEMGFDYIGGYAGRTSKVDIRCRCCGAEFSRSVDAVRDGNTVCLECQKAETIKRHEEERQEKVKAAEEKRKEREVERIKLLEAKKGLDELHVCKECGKEYTLREYMKSTGNKYCRNSGYCSKECKDIHAKKLIKESHKGRKDNHRHRAKKYGCKYDSSVTLKRLIKRNGLRCAICGKMCDPNDHSWTEYSGPMYPSIDHIIPMAKGGGHTWNNVQVAHMICNSQKGDKVEAVS